MRITIVQGAFLPVPPLLGGAVEKMWYILAKDFATRGHQVTYVSRTYANLPKLEVVGSIRFVRVDGFDTPSSLWKLKLLDWVYSGRCARILETADIIVSNTFWLPMFPSVHRIGAVYVDVQRMPKGQMRFYQRAARLRANSRPVEKAILSEVPAMAERVTMIPNLLPFPSVERRHIQSWQNRRRVLLFVGRVHPEKGLHLFIEAFSRIEADARDGWEVHIVGPWSTAEGGGGEAYLQQLKEAAQNLPVMFFGPVHDPAILSEHYSAAALFVYPSLAAKGESFGLAPLEAMAHGSVPVVSGLECFQDFVTHALNGFIFDHASIDPAAALADSLSHLMASPDLCARLSAKAWEVNLTHAPEKIADLFLDDFERVIEESRSDGLSMARG